MPPSIQIPSPSPRCPPSPSQIPLPPATPECVVCQCSSSSTVELHQVKCCRQFYCVSCICKNSKPSHPSSGKCPNCRRVEAYTDLEDMVLQDRCAICLAHPLLGSRRLPCCRRQFCLPCIKATNTSCPYCKNEDKFCDWRDTVIQSINRDLIREKIQMIVEDREKGVEQFKQFNSAVTTLKSFIAGFWTEYTKCAVITATKKTLGQRTTTDALRRMINKEQKQLREKEFKTNEAFRQLSEEFDDFVSLVGELAESRGYISLLEEEMASRC